MQRPGSIEPTFANPNPPQLQQQPQHLLNGLQLGNHQVKSALLFLDIQISSDTLLLDIAVSVSGRDIEVGRKVVSGSNVVSRTPGGLTQQGNLKDIANVLLETGVRHP